MPGAAQQAGASGLVLVAGHESGDPPALERLPLPAALAGVPVRAVRPGRDLERALAAAISAGTPQRPVVVLAMTLGRDPRLVSDAARTVRWVTRDDERAGRPARVALAPPLGTADHLVGWLRTACRRLRDDDAAVLIAATSSDPFDDAELHRVAALVRTHGRHRLVEVGLRDPGGGLGAGIDRCRRLGADRVAVAGATLEPADDVDEPLLSPPALAQVVAARVATACHRLAAHGDDGVAAALAADHAHGFAHSHAHDHAHAGAHAHDHDHDHDHDDPHDRAQASVG